MDLTQLSDAKLLALWADVMTELKSRDVIRSANNPVADYAERLVADQLGLTLAPPSTPGYDATGPDDKPRYQIKARRGVSGPKRQLGAIRNLDQGGFDYLVVVLFDGAFGVDGMWRFPIDLVRDHAVYRKHVNAHILRLTSDVLNDPRAERLV